jgi:hypothetical protein
VGLNIKSDILTHVMLVIRILDNKTERREREHARENRGDGDAGQVWQSVALVELYVSHGSECENDGTANADDHADDDV